VEIDDLIPEQEGALSGDAQRGRQPLAGQTGLSAGQGRSSARQKGSSAGKASSSHTGMSGASGRTSASGRLSGASGGSSGGAIPSSAVAGSSGASAKSSAVIRRRVEKAREIQRERFRCHRDPAFGRGYTVPARVLQSAFWQEVVSNCGVAKIRKGLNVRP